MDNFNNGAVKTLMQAIYDYLYENEENSEKSEDEE